MPILKVRGHGKSTLKFIKITIKVVCSSAKGANSQWLRYLYKYILENSSNLFSLW